MRIIPLVCLGVPLATSLSAQVPTTRAASFDVAALVSGGLQAGVEALVIGRVSVGLVGGRWTSKAPDDYAYATQRALGGGRPTVPADVQYGGRRIEDWSLDLAVRYYPAALSVADPQRRLSIYVGEFIGYRQRTVEEPPICLVCMYPLDSDATLSGLADSILPPPQPFPIRVARVRRRVTGWEPGLEIGVRLMPFPPAFIDVGGRFRLIRLEDPTGRTVPGQVQSHLVLAVGVGW